MFRLMDMRLWLEKAEAEIAAVPLSSLISLHLERRDDTRVVRRRRASPR